MDFVNQFRNALQNAFGPLDWLPEPDGAIHRFHTPDDRPGVRSGWYLLFADGTEGCFGSLRTCGTFAADSGQLRSGS